MVSREGKRTRTFGIDSVEGHPTQPVHKMSEGSAVNDAIAKNANASLIEAKTKDIAPTKRRRRRKRARRKWKPYDQMSRDEKEAYDEYRTRIETKKREELWRRGKPGAPFNTNRFLIEDHGTDDEIVFSERPKRSISLESSFSDDLTTLTTTSSEEGGGADDVDDEALFIQNGEREFDEMYERLHEEKLSSMSRDELVNEIVDLERLLAVEKDRNADEIQGLRRENCELREKLQQQ